MEEIRSILDIMPAGSEIGNILAVARRMANITKRERDWKL